MHNLSVKKVAVNAMSKIVHQAGKHDTFLLTFCEGYLLPALLALLPEDVHLLVAEMCDATTVLEAIVGSARENIIVGAKLVNVLEPLQLWSVDEKPTVSGQADEIVNDV